MRDADRSAAFRRLEAFVMDHRRALLGPPRRYTHLDPEDLLQAAYSRALGILARASTQQELDRRLAGMLRPSYWHTALRNQSHDQHDVVRREVSVPDDRLEPGAQRAGLARDPDADPVADEVVGRVAADERRTAIGCALRALVARGVRLREAGSQREHPRITTAQWEVLQALADLAREEQNVRGLQSGVARRLNLSRETVSQHRRTILAMLHLTRYVAGVLGVPRTLLSEVSTEGALDAYDAWLADRPDATTGLLVEALAASVRTYADSGTRARPALLPVRVQSESPPEDIHDLEAAFATVLDNPHPNCAACCAPHNPTPDRITEF